MLNQEKKSFTMFSDVMKNPVVSNSPADLHQADTYSSGGANKNIVIGMAQDTDPKNLVTFCASLRK